MSRTARVLTMLGLAAGFVAVSGTPAHAAIPTLGGGSGIVFDQGKPGAPTPATGLGCTLTAVGYDRSDNLVALTNAHCFTAADGTKLIGDEVYRDKSPAGTSVNWATKVEADLDAGPLGTVAYVSEQNNLLSGGPPGLDFAVIKLDPARVAPTKTVGGVTLTSVGPPPAAGTIMCKEGHTTGLTCGMKLGTNGKWFTHTVWTWSGDSGSPVAVGQTLVGNAWGAQHSSPILSIIDEMNANGGVGAGFRLAT
ncbi:trypsin-like peptidase domain-containing protein [Spirillospora sp. NPDC047279]|uniref:trypsin-like peptidase domain-containing protein n=1 Tax=Spirillospora sp. NPDC047279 TaxID=3155478 RepID=UPI0033F7E053